MQLNAFKCNVICIAWARNPIACFYSLCGQVLQEVDTGKYLSAELNWSPRFSGVSSKTNSTLSFLCRYLRKCPQPLRRQQLYISCDPLSSMLPQSKILILPQTSPLRRSSIMIVKGDYNTTTSITTRLTRLCWQQLEDHRRDFRVALMYKVVHGLVAVPVDSLNLIPKDSRTRSNH